MEKFVEAMGYLNALPLVPIRESNTISDSVPFCLYVSYYTSLFTVFPCFRFVAILYFLDLTQCLNMFLFV